MALCVIAFSFSVMVDSIRLLWSCLLYEHLYLIPDLQVISCMLRCLFHSSLFILVDVYLYSIGISTIRWVCTSAESMSDIVFCVCCVQHYSWHVSVRLGCGVCYFTALYDNLVSRDVIVWGWFAISFSKQCQLWPDRYGNVIPSLR